jgi:lipopolysaccharide export system protein LptC
MQTRLIVLAALLAAGALLGWLATTNRQTAALAQDKEERMYCGEYIVLPLKKTG